MIRAADLVKTYQMIPHEENGAFCLHQYEVGYPGRARSGSIYYYLGPDEYAHFHKLDCDEYWVWSAGTPLEIWSIDPSGILTKQFLGLGEGMQPLVWIIAGTAFGARHLPGADDGTFVSCITVPRFDYAGWRLLNKEEVIAQCPAVAEFYEEK